MDVDMKEDGGKQMEADMVGEEEADGYLEKEMEVHYYGEKLMQVEQLSLPLALVSRARHSWKRRGGR